jgi:2-iminobutanoate/2-iminopropanoate deaminase
MMTMKTSAIRVEPYATYIEARLGMPFFPVLRAGDLLFVAGLPPFDPGSGAVERLPFERQAEIVLEQMRHCLEAAGSSLAQVVKCNVYATPDPTHFARFNAVYARFFPAGSPARIFIHVPSWPGPFDIEVDCVAAI